MNRRLRVVDRRSSDYVEIPRSRLSEAAIAGQAACDEIAVVYQLVWQTPPSPARTRALLAIRRMHLELSVARASFHRLAGDVEAAPSVPLADPAPLDLIPGGRSVA